MSLFGFNFFQEAANYCFDIEGEEEVLDNFRE